MYNPDDDALGGFTPYDGTVEFYGRLRSLLQPGFTVVDLGAGRGAWFLDDGLNYRRTLRDMRGHVARLIGCDVDPAVLSNPACDENVLLDNGRIPLADGSVDLVFADCVLEHIEDPNAFYAEVTRVLRPGGFFCARTPHRLNYVTLIGGIIKNSLHGPLLRRIQPERKSMDVFPTSYKLNTIRAIRRYWRPELWRDYSYVYVSEPRYYFGSRPLYALFAFLHRHLPMSLAGVIHVFMQKRDHATRK
jgi:SAM-dependent methyltransferase